jgi:rhodanese-related sulfurtransferase
MLRFLPLLFVLACSDASEPTDSPAGTDDLQTDTEAPAEPEVHVIDADTLKGWIDEGEDFHLINVHVPRAGEIPGTDIHIAYNDVDAIEAQIGDPDALVVLYCRTGPMSAQASAALVGRDYTQIYDLTVAMVGWQHAGYQLGE